MATESPMMNPRPSAKLYTVTTTHVSSLSVIQKELECKKLEDVAKFQLSPCSQCNRVLRM